jgi:hypothetical protein
MIKLADMIPVWAIGLGKRAAVKGNSGIVDTVNGVTGNRARRAMVIFKRTGVLEFSGAGPGSNANFRYGLRSASGSSTLYASGTALPVTVSAASLTVSGAAYAIDIDLTQNVKRYLIPYLSNATTSATNGCLVLLYDFETLTPTSPKASSATSRYGFTSITNVPNNP